MSEHPAEDLLIDLAISDVNDQSRDALASHLGRCPFCRARYREISDSVDQVLTAAPRVAPPPGFSASVLEAMGVLESGGVLEAGGEPRSPAAPPAIRPVARLPRWRQRVLIALVAAASVLLGVAGTAVVLNRQAQSQQAVAAGTALVARTGQTVGHVQDARYNGQPVFVVTVTNGPPGVRYSCQLMLADGTRQAAGAWTLPATGSATWVVDRPTAEVASMALVSDTGNTWATAGL